MPRNWVNLLQRNSHHDDRWLVGGRTPAGGLELMRRTRTRLRTEFIHVIYDFKFKISLLRVFVFVITRILSCRFWIHLSTLENHHRNSLMCFGHWAWIRTILFAYCTLWRGATLSIHQSMHPSRSRSPRAEASKWRLCASISHAQSRMAQHSIWWAVLNILWCRNQSLSTQRPRDKRR